MKRKLQLFISVVLTATLLAGISVPSVASTSGALWTTDATGTVNQNHYATKADVYLNGGPHKENGNLTDGNYYVRVIQPQGQKELGYSTTANVIVSGGKFAISYQLINLVNMTSDSAKKGFDDSSNNVYKVQIGTYNVSKAKSKKGFDINSEADREACWTMLKNDNFTVGGNGAITVTKVVENEIGSTYKFYVELSDENGVTSVYEVSAATPLVITNLLPGKYELQEVNIPEGYQLKTISKSEIHLANGNMTASVTIINTKTQADPTASPSPSPEVTASPSPSPEVSASPSPSPEVTTSPSPSPEVTASPSPSPEVTASPSPSPEVTASPSPSPEVTASPSPSPEVTASPSPSPEVTASPSPSPEVTASPSPSPEVNASPSPSPVTVPETTPPAAPVVISVPEPATENFTLTTSVIGQGSVSPGPGTNTYSKGSIIQLNPTPAEGWQFTGWQGDTVSGSNQIYMDSDKSVTAVFTEIPPVAAQPAVTIQPEQVPQAPAVQEPDTATVDVAEEAVPQAPATLPKTGGIPTGLFYGFGGLITAAGVLIGRRKQQ